MQSGHTKSLLILAVFGAVLWKLGMAWFGPVVEPGKVTMLTSENFQEVRKAAGTLLAVYIHPG